jgi:LuxR family transcriptional regulator, quorum-sensing system regulator SolR
MRFTDDDLHVAATENVPMFDYVANHFRALGFSYCSFRLRLPMPLAEPRLVIMDTYPASWRERFAQQNYRAVDPTIAHAFKSEEFLLWSPEVFKDAGDMWEDCNAHGLNVGWAKPGRCDGSIGMLSLSRQADALSSVEIAAHAQDMARMNDMLLATLSCKLVAAYVPESQVRLTLREKEVLRWTADGKTAYEIGRILSLSVATINFHLNKAVAKLDAVNKTQAVVKAVILRLL